MKTLLIVFLYLVGSFLSVYLGKRLTKTSLVARNKTDKVDVGMFFTFWPFILFAGLCIAGLYWIGAVINHVFEVFGFGESK